MSPTSRNVLMIGGALILIALFLVCGPLSDRLGRGGKSVEEAPPVAAGPPVDAVDTTDVVEAVAAGALVGASIGEIEVAALEDVKAEADSVVVVGDPGTGGGGRVRPAVSAGVPTTAAAGGEISGADADTDAAAAAAEALDDSIASGDELGVAGAVVDRFPPPVAAAGDSSLALAAAAEPFGIDSGNLLQPCDSPGSGCQNLSSGSIGGGGVTPFGSGSPRGPR